MTFIHNFLPSKELIRIDSTEGRTYKTDTGNCYESVTSWLGRSSDHSYIDEWKARIGEEEARKITTRATNRGTTLHENVEMFLRNNTVTPNSMLDKSLFAPFAVILTEHVNNIRALETKLYSDILKLAGTVDCLAEYDGVLSLIDFKTSKARKNKEDIDNYFIQCTIYSLMIEELYGVKADQIVVLIAVDYENKVQMFKESRKDWIKKLVARIKEVPPLRIEK